MNYVYIIMTDKLFVVFLFHHDFIMYVIYISIRLYLNVFILECFYHVFQGPTGEQHIAEWATLVKYIEINK